MANALSPYYRNSGSLLRHQGAAHRACHLTTMRAAIVEAFKPSIVSFHFGLPPEPLLCRVKASGAAILASATTVDEARWLERRGVDAVVAQGLEAGGRRARSPSNRRTQTA